ncbi:MAG: hypothetical protein RLZZ123_2553 [Pseudomonadota bacterium]
MGLGHGFIHSLGSDPNFFRRLKASEQDPSVQLAIENFEDLNMNMKRVFENYKKQCRAED